MGSDKTSKTAYIFNDTRSTNHFGSWRVMRNLETLLEDSGFSVAGTKEVVKKGDCTKPLDFKEADIVVVNGEGTIHHDEERPRARFLAMIPELVRRTRHCPVVLLNATIQDLSEPGLDYIRGYSYISVRDTESQKYLSENGICSDYAPDLSFLNPPARSREGSGLAVTDSVDESISNGLRNYAEEVGADFKNMKLASSPAGHFLKRLFFHPLRTHRAANSRRILDASEDEFMEFIDNHKSMITGRYHAVAYALMLRVPFVAVSSNTSKIEFLLQDVFGSTERCIQELRSIDNMRSDFWTEFELSDIEQFFLCSEAKYDHLMRSLKRICS